MTPLEALTRRPPERALDWLAPQSPDFTELSGSDAARFVDKQSGGYNAERLFSHLIHNFWFPLCMTLLPSRQRRALTRQQIKNDTLLI
jgi:hypothetical protein